MEKEQIERILQSVVMSNGISVQQVKKDIQYAIEEALRIAKKNEDLQTITNLQEISGSANCPTAEDVILWGAIRMRDIR